MSDAARFSIAIVGAFWAFAWMCVRGMEILREWDRDE